MLIGCGNFCVIGRRRYPPTHRPVATATLMSCCGRFFCAVIPASPHQAHSTFAAVGSTIGHMAKMTVLFGVLLIILGISTFMVAISQEPAPATDATTTQ